MPRGRPTGEGYPAGLRLLRPLGIRDFRLLWTGMTVSLFGDGIFLVALAWQVYQISDVPTALSVVGVAISLPHVLFLVLGGVLSDRLDRRRVMVAADSVRGATLAAMGILSLGGTLQLRHIIGLAAVYGGATAFFGPAFDAIVPDVVPAHLLSEANSLDQFVRPATLRIAGPAAAGWVIALGGPGSALLVDAGTFVVGVVCFLLMRPGSAAGRGERGVTPAERTERAAGSTVAQVREGFRFVRTRVWLWGTFAAAALAYLLFMGPTEVLLPFIVKHDLRGSAGVLGFVFAMGGLGAICGALVMGRRGIPRRHVTFMYLAWGLATFAVAGYGLAREPWQAMAAGFIFNALETAGTIVWATTKHRLVPPALQGRVSSFDWLISIGLVPISFAVTGPVAAVLGARSTLAWAGTLGGMVTLGALFVPHMRDIERRGALLAGASPDPGSDPAERPAERAPLSTLPLT